MKDQAKIIATLYKRCKALKENEVIEAIETIGENHPAVAATLSSFTFDYNQKQFLEVARAYLMVPFYFEKSKFKKEVSKEVLDNTYFNNEAMLAYIEKEKDAALKDMASDAALQGIKNPHLFTGIMFYINESPILKSLDNAQRAMAIFNGKILLEGFEHCL